MDTAPSSFGTHQIIHGKMLDGEDGIIDQDYF